MQPETNADDLAIAALCHQIAVPDKVWEPCCGHGAIAAYLSKVGTDMIVTDMVDRGYGVPVIEFLEIKNTLADAVITNPPPLMAHLFIDKAYALGIRFMAMLLKTEFWHTRKSMDLFDIWRPRYVLPLTFKGDYAGRRAQETAEARKAVMAWSVWDGVAATTDYIPLSKPII